MSATARRVPVTRVSADHLSSVEIQALVAAFDTPVMTCGRLSSLDPLFARLFPAGQLLANLCSLWTVLTDQDRALAHRLVLDAAADATLARLEPKAAPPPSVAPRRPWGALRLVEGGAR